MVAPAPRWLTGREVPAAARVVHAAYGGWYARHLVKVLLTPHVTVSRHAAVLGVGPDHGRRSLGRRVVDSVVHAAWLTAATGRRECDLPWVLRPSYAAGWRLVNLAKSPRLKEAPAAVIALSGHVLALADSTGMNMLARVDLHRSRLLEAYLHRGFRVVTSGDGVAVLTRPARRGGDSEEWQFVLRTGRLTLSAWRARFGSADEPFLDLGAGDSLITSELVASDVLAVAVDPQFAVVAPAQDRRAIAATAEHLPFRDGTFATVNANFVLQHVAHPRQALAECLRVLRPGGRLVLHPVWAWRFFRNRLARIPGVHVLPGRLSPPGRQRPSMTLRAGEFDVVAHGAEVAAALRPHPIIALLGRAAMPFAIRVARRRTR